MKKYSSGSTPQQELARGCRGGREQGRVVRGAHAVKPGLPRRDPGPCAGGALVWRLWSPLRHVTWVTLTLGFACRDPRRVSTRCLRFLVCQWKTHVLSSSPTRQDFQVFASDCQQKFCAFAWTVLLAVCRWELSYRGAVQSSSSSLISQQWKLAGAVVWPTLVFCSPSRREVEVANAGCPSPEDAPRGCLSCLTGEMWNAARDSGSRAEASRAGGGPVRGPLLLPSHPNTACCYFCWGNESFCLSTLLLREKRCVNCPFWKSFISKWVLLAEATAAREGDAGCAQAE